MAEVFGLVSFDVLGHPFWMWAFFLTVVLLLLAFDLGFLNKKDKEIGIRKSFYLSAFYIGIALIFGGWIYYELGADRAVEYYTGYFVEKVLSLDNVFVISLIFAFFGIERKFQYRALVYGILGAIVMRAIMIYLGISLIETLHWMIYVFGAFLIFTGVKMLFSEEEEQDIGNNFVVKFLRKYARVSDEVHGQKFFIKKFDENIGKKALYATPVFLAFIVINIVDLIFAVDSVPAVIAITRDPFIVYTSNIFAILGLRALYFALAAMIHRFYYLKYSLSIILVFIGGKIYFNEMFFKINPIVSLVVTLGLILVGVLVSLMLERKESK